MKEIDIHAEILQNLRALISKKVKNVYLDSLDYAIHFLKSAKEVEKEERYFLIHYRSIKDNKINFGYITLRTNGKFVNEKECVEFICEDRNVNDAVITNIQELSKEDYNEFIK